MTTYIVTDMHGTYEATPYAEMAADIVSYLDSAHLYSEERAEVYLYEVQGGYRVDGPVIRLDECGQDDYAQVSGYVNTRTARRLVKNHLAKYYESG